MGLLLFGMTLVAGCAKSEDEQETSLEEESAVEEATVSLDYDGLQVTIWMPENLVDFSLEQVSDFLEEYPAFSGADIEILEADEEKAAEEISAAGDSGVPDIYLFSQDQMERLVLMGALEGVPDSYLDAVENENDAGAVLAASLEGTLMAYPFSSQKGYLLYYDADIISDPTDLDTILSDCRNMGRTFCMELNSGWYQAAFFLGTGCSLSYEVDENGVYTAANVTYASDEGIAALRSIIELSQDTAFENVSAAGDTENMAALVGGIWDALVVQELLGDSYACTVLPSFTGEDEKTYQLSGFSGYTLLGVYPQESEEKRELCQKLAFWFCEESQQKERYEEEAVAPSNTAVQNEVIAGSDAALYAMQQQMLYGIPQGALPADYWTLAASLGDDVITGSLAADAEDEVLLEALQSFQDTCLSYVEGES